MRVTHLILSNNEFDDVIHKSGLREYRNLGSERGVQGWLTLAVTRNCTIMHRETPFFAAVSVDWVMALGMACDVRASSRDTPLEKALV